MPSNVHVLAVQTATLEAAGSTAEDAIAHNLHRAVHEAGRVALVEHRRDAQAQPSS